MPSKIFMVRPVNFGFNLHTANSNSFQNEPKNHFTKEIQEKALLEFNNFIELLLQNKIDVTVFDDDLEPHTPDSIFPNNWISFHENNTIVLYPMLAINRRKERKESIITKFTTQKTNLIDLTLFENENVFLEGTGSIIFDNTNKIAYANKSPRTNGDLFEMLCSQLEYTPILFSAVDINDKDIYHTNVLMTLGKSFAIICFECIKDINERKVIMQSLAKTNHEIIEITYSQLNSFAGNMYQLFNSENKSYIIMSQQAFSSLTTSQIKAIEKHGKILSIQLDTIEKYGGGSARCMIAEIIN